jgi:hypothetical protein
VTRLLALLRDWARSVWTDLLSQLRWSFLPPLMVYLAAGVSGLSAIVGTFFVKEYLSLSAAFLAGLSFWVGIPWALKMPVGHLVDLVWRWKAALVYLGAALIAASIAIMYGLIAHTAAMRAVMPAEAWYVLSALLSPIGYVVQDVVADAMTVEAVPTVDADGRTLGEPAIKAMHTTMQTLGRIAIIGGLTLVAGLNIFMFQGVEAMPESAKVAIYARIYLLSLAVPAVSVAGVVLNGILLARRARALRRAGVPAAEVDRIVYQPGEKTEPNWWILGGAAAFACFTIALGLGGVPFAQEIIFLGSMAIVLFLMGRLLRELPPERARMLVGTAIIIFVFRAVPLPGPGATWFQIDVLGFDQRFLAVLEFITSLLTLVGMVVLRPLMASRSIAYIAALLSVASSLLLLPYVGLYYGLHHWTAAWTWGIVDARFIAVINTAIESPLGQVAMIPMLAWIARNAPAHLKATFFAVMASFTNLALSAASLGTKYLNEVFVVTREARDAATGAIQTAADYSQLGRLLIAVAVIGVVLPLGTIAVVQRTRLKTVE